MPFLEFLFSPQAHKFRNGYFINHDTLMNGKNALMQLVLMPGTNSSSTSLPNNYPISSAYKIVTPMNPRGNNIRKWQN